MPDSPFKLLEPYGPGEGGDFHGRDGEVYALYNLLRQSRLVLVYGASGTGKTSLLQAGLSKAFKRTEWLPVYIRRRDDINTALRQELQRLAGGKADPEESLESLITRVYEGRWLPLYLVFDQFEELFTLGKEEEERTRFFTTIAGLLEQSLPCQIILSMREEYIGHLYNYEPLVPTLFEKRFRLEPMKDTTTEEVIDTICWEKGVAMEQPVREPGKEGSTAHLILEKVKQGKKTAAWLPHLQIYLHYLYLESRVDEESRVRFTTEAVEKVGELGDVLRQFVTSQLEEAQSVFNSWGAPQGLAWRLLNEFATLEGTKQAWRTADLARKLGQDEPLVQRALTHFSSTSAKLLRADENEQGRFEPMHDVIAGVIHELRSPEDKEFREFAARLGRSYGQWVKEERDTERLLPSKDIQTAEVFAERLAREHPQHIEDWTGYIEASKGFINKQERRKRWLNLTLFLLSVFAIGFGVFAYYQRGIAIENEQEANLAQQADSLKAIKLGIALNKAEKAELMAKDSATYAREQEMIAKDALNESRRMAARTVPVLLREADNYILALQYDTALVRAQAAWDLNAKRAQVVRTFQEIAYFYTESNALDKAGTALDYIGRSPRRRSNQQEALRAVVKKIDFAYWRDTLETRYYPDMVEVPGGTFQMGCHSTKLKEIFGADEDCPPYELPRHEVTLKPFRIARTETTVWQYYLYTQADTMRSMTSEPSWGWKGNHPVVNASWYDVLAYANWLSTRRGEKKQVYNLDIPKDANEPRKQEDSIDWWDSAIVRWELGGFRLPTEAEWEYAARGGPNSNGYLFAGGDSPEEVAIFDVGGGTRPVRSKSKNELGLYDMSGNVWEWCWDWYGEDFYSEPEAGDNPRGAKSGSSRVLRGGSWFISYTYGLRSSLRSGNNPWYGDYYVGFRLSQGY